MTKTLKKSCASFLSLVMLLSMLLYFPSGTFDQFGIGLKANAASITPSMPQAGDGSADSPYEISTAAELYWFADKVNNENETYTNANAVLTEDIVVNENVLNSNGELNSGTFEPWTSIGSSGKKYSGAFDGQGHTISGLYFNREKSYVGLFGFVVKNGTVSNVGIIDSYFEGVSYVGGVCGQSDGTITNCYNTSAVSGLNCVGGVCGDSEGTITNCYNTGTVSGSLYVGGVSGRSDQVTITNCYNTGAVSGSKTVGGVSGRSDQGTITNCYNTGAVSGSETVGGVSGRILSKGKITNCYYDSDKYSGNAVGYNGGVVADVNGKTTAQFNSGEVAYLLSQGCTIGKGEDAVTYDGSVWGQTIGTDNYPVLGGAKVYYGYEKCNSTEMTYSNKAISQTKPAHDYDNGFCKDCNAYEPATQNADGVYEIGNAGQLYWFADKVNNENATYKSASAVLTEDIVVNENVLNDNGELNSGTFETWTPIGSNKSEYGGTFDGKDHTVSGLYFNSSVNNVGFFGYVASGGNVLNVGVVDSYFKGNFHVGGVCGYAVQGTITNCYNTGTVNGFNAGGVCGWSDHGTITNCYNTGAVIGDSIAGGVCGANSNQGIITNCHNTGAVDTDSMAGGVCALNDLSTIANCYYLEGTASCGINGIDVEGSAEVKTEAQFASGEVAYLLSQGCTIGEGEDAVTYDGSVWGQAIGTDKYPVWGGAKVYRYNEYSSCDKSDTPVNKYSNTETEDVVASHSYINGICKNCGYFRNNVGTNLAGYSLTLNGSIGVNFYMMLDPRIIADDSAYMLFTLPNGGTKSVFVKDADIEYVDGEEYYVFSCEVAAKEMFSKIKAQIITDSISGTVYSFKVEDYANKILDNSQNYSERTVALVKTMMQYGKYAEAYFAGETLGAAEEMNNVTAETLANAVPVESGELPEGISYYGSSMLLESDTMIRHYFKVEEGTDVSAYNFSGNKGNYYYMDIAALPGKSAADCVVGEYTLNYATECYVHAVLASENTADNLKQVAIALYLFDQAAEGYRL